MQGEATGNQDSSYWQHGKQSSGSVPPQSLQEPPHLPSLSCLGRYRTTSLAGGGFTNVGNEDPAKINCYQAASPANKPASHWLTVMSLSG